MENEKGLDFPENGKWQVYIKQSRCISYLGSRLLVELNFFYSTLTKFKQVVFSTSVFKFVKF